MEGSERRHGLGRCAGFAGVVQWSELEGLATKDRSLIDETE